MEEIKILWVDDEIDLLKPHIIFLETKGYNVDTCNNGNDAIDLTNENRYDIVFLDENMPGKNGLETLNVIKENYPSLPIVMITKSEEESIMEDAIGGDISDYLIKPVNPNQILLALKKNLEKKTLVDEKNTHTYQQEFRNIGMDLNNYLDHQEWIDMYKKLVSWEIRLKDSEDDGIKQILKMQKEEANTLFSRFYKDNYIDWINGRTEDKPLQSHTILKEKLFPSLSENRPTFFFLIDNLRYDQWKAIQPIVEQYFNVKQDDIYYGIIPTATQYARNALFSGLLPSVLAKRYPQYWTTEEEQGTKNQYEKELLEEYLKRYGLHKKVSYNKILNLNAGKRLVENMGNLMNKDLNVIVYNFIDTLSHARTEMDIIKELAEDEIAYRSLTVSWFEHSPLLEMFKYLSEKDVDVVITTDHGSVRVNNPVKVLGDRNTNTNLRYKYGRNLQYNPKEVFQVKNPNDIHMPKVNVSTSYIFCESDDYFVYPNNFNYYAKMYEGSFQHGGISLEEVLIPYIELSGK